MDRSRIVASHTFAIDSQCHKSLETHAELQPKTHMHTVHAREHIDPDSPVNTKSTDLVLSPELEPQLSDQNKHKDNLTKTAE